MQEGNLDFYHISLVDDKCQWAKQRRIQYNLYGFPTVFHDGGYDVDVGAGSTQGAKTTYTNSLNYCGNRVVPNIDVDTKLEWLGGALMRVTVTVDNNTPSNYEGTVRAFITEKVSSLNWKDGFQNLYTYPMLDYAMVEAVDIPANSTWSNTIEYDGALHNSGMGQSYANITWNNIAIITGVYNAEWHQGYAYPPSSNPFDAYYVDETNMGLAENIAADTYELPETGGDVNVGIYAGNRYSGEKYILLAGVTGSSPGTNLPGGLVLPLNIDVFTNYFVFPLINTSLFANFMGVLDGTGSAMATLSAGALPAGHTGTILTMAYCTYQPYSFVSDPIEVEIVP